MWILILQGLWLAYCNVPYESVEHDDDTAVSFKNKFVLKNESNA